MIKILSTKCQILRLKYTKSFVGWGSAPDPVQGACSAPPNLLHLDFRGLLLREGRRKRGGVRKKEKMRGTEGRAFPLL